MTSLTPTPDAQPAEWVARGLRGFAQSVLSLVPGVFEAYVRVFHPARAMPSRIVTRHRKRPKAHAGMQLNA